jgi:integrase
MPPIVHRIPAPASAQDVTRLLNAARGSPLLPVLVLVLSGLRPRGALRLRWQDVDLKQRQVRSFEKGRERLIPLGPWAVAQLKPLVAEGPLWPFSHDTAHDVLRALREARGLPGTLTLQSLRRAATARLYAAGVPPQQAARLQGHSVATAERHYVEIASLEARGAAAKLDFGGKIIRKTLKGKMRKSRKSLLLKHSRRGLNRSSQVC